MNTFLTTHRHRAVPTVLSVLLLVASAVGTWAVIPAKAAPAVPTVATAGGLPSIVRPAPRTPGALVIPKKKKPKKKTVVSTAVQQVATAPVTQTQTATATYTAPVTHTATHTASHTAASTADDEFGPG